MRRRFALVYNSTAGPALPRLLDGVLSRLRDEPVEVFQVPARSAIEASERVRALAARGACDVVVAAGGDGTFRAVATGAAGSGVPVGLIPLGTGNVLAREIGLERRPATVANVLLSGPVIAARGGTINGAPFFLVTGAGFDARIVSRLDYRAKRMFGRGAFTYPVIKTLFEGPRLFDVEIDGRRFEASWVILSFARRYGGAFVLTEGTGFGRDTLVAVVIEARSRFAITSSVVSLALGWLAKPETRPAGVHVLPVKRAHIGRLTTAPIEVDGDAAGLSPVEISADGPTVRLIVPESYVADLTNRHANHVA